MWEAAHDKAVWFAQLVGSARGWGSTACDRRVIIAREMAKNKSQKFFVETAARERERESERERVRKRKGKRELEKGREREWGRGRERDIRNGTEPIGQPSRNKPTNQQTNKTTDQRTDRPAVCAGVDCT